MKKLLGSLLVVVMTLAVLAGCQKETVDNQTSQPSQSQMTKIVIGLDENFPPMGFRDEQQNLVGFDIDLAEEVAKRIEATIEFQPINWDSKEIELKSKKVDVLWNGLTITDARKLDMLFTKPYLQNKQVILVKTDSVIAGKTDLAGKNVGVQRGSSAVGAVEKDTATAQTLTMKEYENNTEAYTDLEIGRVDAVVLDEVVAKYYITKNPNKFKILNENFGSEEYGVGTRLEDTELNAKIQKALDEMIADGTAAKISEKWFGEDKLVKN